MDNSRQGELKAAQEAKAKLAGELIDYCLTELEIELSRFRAEMLLDFLLERVSPVVYNQALQDAKNFMAERLEDMDEYLYKAPGRRLMSTAD